jgi:hypothetical protein
MAASRDLYAVGRDIGVSPTVDVWDADTGQLVNRFLAFGGSFTGGIRVATGDVNGDGYTDVVCATGAGGGAVRVFSGEDGSLLAARRPFGRSYRGGVNVAVGDLDGDGSAEIVAGRDGTGSGVRVYAGGSFTLMASFRAFPQFDAQGVSVTVANVERHGAVIAVAASGRTPVLRLFDPSGSIVSTFRGFTGSGFGTTITSADLDGDGFDELAVARSTASNRVRILDPVARAVRASFTVGGVVDPAYGVRLGTLRSSVDAHDTLLVGNGPGSPVAILAFDDLTGVAQRLPPQGSRRAYGIFVG